MGLAAGRRGDASDRADAPTSSEPEGMTEPPLAVVATEAEPSDDPADRWLVALRFVAVAGMALTILGADRLVEGLEITGLMTVLASIAGSNLVWLALLSRGGKRASGARRYVNAQLAVDVVSLAGMLWFAGGVTNPFAAFLVFHIALAGLLTTPRATLAIAGLTILAALVLTLAPPLPAMTPNTLALGSMLALVSLASVLGRVREPHEPAARSEHAERVARGIGAARGLDVA
jgi:two-component system sensor histidine kinase RegB